MKSKQLELVIAKLVDTVIKRNLTKSQAITKLYNAMRKYSKFNECNADDLQYIRDITIIVGDLANLNNERLKK